MRKGRQATGKASLTPKLRKGEWVARGQVPILGHDGKVGSRREERSFPDDCRTEKDRQTQCSRWNAEYEAKFEALKRGDVVTTTFAEAATLYLKAGKELPYYLAEISEVLGDVRCDKIDDRMMVELADDLWDEAAPATINRYLYTPVLAILHHAIGSKTPELKRPHKHNEVQPVIIPPNEWYVGLAPELNRDQLAFMITLRMHGRRTSEMLRRIPKDLDVERGTLDLGKTKTGVRILQLNPKCIPLLTPPGWQRRKWLFSYGPNSSSSLRRDIKAACVRAKLEWYHPHSFGRHASVTAMLQAGYSVAYVADAHGMTPEMVTRRYGHLTKTETTAALHKVGDAFYDRLNRGDIVGGADGEEKPIKLISQDNSLSNPSPSEGDALSNCATGALENPSNYGASSGSRETEQPSTGQEQT